MEKDNTPKPAAPARTVTLIDARDQFIGVALAEIIKSQLAKGSWDHSTAASHAVRYADAVMRQRATISPVTVAQIGQKFVPDSEVTPYEAGGVPTQPPAPITPPAPVVPSTGPAAVVPPVSIPAPIADRIGAQPPLVEV
jgi:hypothetical protein